jgi:hypothetical protein
MSNYGQTLVIGLGGAGRNTCNDFQAQGAPYQLISIDQGDGIELALHVSFSRDSRWSEEKKIFSSIDDCAAFLKERTSKVAKLIFIAGLGGRTGSKLFRYFVNSSDFKSATFVCFLPFKFEGEDRKKVATDVIAQINKDIVDLRVYSNQDLLESAHPKETFTEAFKRRATEIYIGISNNKKEYLTKVAKKLPYPRQFERPEPPFYAKKDSKPHGRPISAPTRPAEKTKENKALRTKKILAFIISLAIIAPVIYEKITLDGVTSLNTKGFFEETVATLNLILKSTQNLVSNPPINSSSTGMVQSPIINQIQWVDEAKNTFFQLSTSERARIQKWLANNYGYNGALDGLWGPRTEASFLRARSTHDDVDRLFMTAIRETPAIRQVARPTAQTVSPTNAQQELQNRIIQLRVACSISPQGSVGERMADQQLYNLTGERCARPPPVFQPIAPIQPNGPTRCTTLPRWSHMPPSLTNLEIYCQ